MKTRPARIAILGILTVGILTTLKAHGDIGYQFVTVGNAGNTADPTTGVGAVSYTYDIGEYDVTLSQYTTFLDAVANSDPYGLYSGNLNFDMNVAGISRSGSSGSYTYSVIGDGNRPVTYMTWLDAARFANWMQNDQPSGLGEVAGSTEQGAYTLDGDTSGGLETRNANATYWIPSEDEYYKAAFYDPTLNSGSGGYWKYATRNNTAPGNNAQNPTLPNQANYVTLNGDYSVTQSSSFSNSQNYLTDVGLFSNSASYYGTYDQNGDVGNWTDSLYLNGPDSTRGLQAGGWDGSAANMSAGQHSVPPTYITQDVGFRLASSVPEPRATVNLIVVGGLLLAKRKRFSAL